jgi:hypothetical protein
MKDGQGNEALSSHDIQKATKPPSLVPVGTVFSRILNALPPNCNKVKATTPSDSSLAAVEQALQQIELASAAEPPAEHSLPTSPIVNAEAAHFRNLVEGLELSASAAAVDQNQDLDPMGDAVVMPSSVQDATTCNAVAFFVNPTPPILQEPTPPQTAATPAPAPCRRQQRVFDMSSVRRSARLAAARPMTQMQRAQQNLCRKLGLLHEDVQPVEAALQEFVAMFNGPLPADVIAALTEIFNLSDDTAAEMDEALIDMAGDGVADLQEEAFLADA